MTKTKIYIFEDDNNVPEDEIICRSIRVVVHGDYATMRYVSGIITRSLVDRLPFEFMTEPPKIEDK
jgi:hypothetical protein